MRIFRFRVRVSHLKSFFHGITFETPYFSQVFKEEVAWLFRSTIDSVKYSTNLPRLLQELPYHFPAKIYPLVKL